MSTMIKQLHNGDLHKFEKVIIQSGNGYQVSLNIDEIDRIEIYSTGAVILTKSNGELRTYSNADCIFKLPEAVQ